MTWKVPARGEYRLGLHARLPEGCVGAPAQGAFVDDAFVERWQARCQDGLVGGTIAIDGLSATRTDVLVRVAHAGGATQTVRLTPESAAFVVAAEASALDVARTYFFLGVEHILLGFDHLLFVLGLLFLVGSGKQLVGTVTTFTVAHSLTLAGATLGWVYAPQAPIEAVIALSVMFLAAEILHRARGQEGLTARAPWLVAFVFGLLHGFGFAGALSDVGLPEQDIPLALLFFNVGVEVGQLAFIAAVVLLLSAFAWIRRRFGQPARSLWQADAYLRVPVAYAIGTVAAFWTVQRVIGFWA
ncbi:MAG: HupE/UreJ family protein [Arenimonas sp.]|nr:HupE/UreJ family protein [Arenimonas sp.]